MDATAVLTADLLDIIFEDRNKSYGAYELRKHYRERLFTAMAAVFLLIGLLFIAYRFTDRFSIAEVTPAMALTEIVLVDIDPPARIIPLPRHAAISPGKAKVFITVPKIVLDAVALKDEIPPDLNAVAEGNIGLVALAGDKGDDPAESPLNNNRGVVAALKKDGQDKEKFFLPIEIESTYPGGASLWIRYLNKSLRYPEEAQSNGIQGIVVVQFIVEQSGATSNVEAISGPIDLREEAVRVIGGSGKWIPALQNGRKVRSYKKQPIVFRLDNL